MYGILGTVTNLHVMSIITKPFVMGLITNLSLRAQLQTSVVCENDYRPFATSSTVLVQRFGFAYKRVETFLK